MMIHKASQLDCRATWSGGFVALRRIDGLEVRDPAVE